MTADTAATSSPTSASPVRVSEGQAVCDLVARPYKAHLAGLAEVKDRAAVAAALSPSRLTAVMRDGVSLALDQYGPRLSPRTSGLVAGWLQQHVRNADQLADGWRGLSEGSASEIARGFRAGFASPEAKVGTALGSVLGGIGGFAGGMIGTFLALHRDDQAFATRLQSYLGEVDRWFTMAAADFDSRVLPRVERDLNPWPHRAWWVVGIGFALCAVGATAWLAH